MVASLAEFPAHLAPRPQSETQPSVHQTLKRQRWSHCVWGHMKQRPLPPFLPRLRDQPSARSQYKPHVFRPEHPVAPAVQRHRGQASLSSHSPVMRARQSGSLNSGASLPFPFLCFLVFSN